MSIQKQVLNSDFTTSSKISQEIINNENIGTVEDAQEEEQLETGKKKKQLSEHQIEHLNKIRVKALERKREIKLQKHKQYEEECRKKRQENIKEVPLIQPTEQPKEQPKEEPKEHAVQPKEEPKKKKK